MPNTPEKMSNSEPTLSPPPPSRDPSSGASATTKLAWGYVAIVLTIGLAWMIATPPNIFSDSVSGFLVMRSMERGAAFNHTFHVDPDDIAVDRAEFMAWWTPGQYLIPMLIASAGLDLGQSMLITIVLAWLIGVAGFGLLCRRLGFTPEVAAISVAALVSQSYVLEWGRYYHGGELLQWSFLPWFILVALRCRELRWHQIAALCAALVLGIFLKSTFAIVGVSAIASLLWLEVRKIGGPFRAQALWLAARAAVAVGVSVAVFGAYTSLGRSPGSDVLESPWSVDLRESLFVAAGPLNSLFDLWKGYISLSESVEWTHSGIGWLLLMVSLASVLLLWAIVRLSGSSHEYLALVVGVYACVVVCFSVALALGVRISFNVRYYRLAGVLFVPGIVALLARIPSRTIRRTSLGLLAVLCLTSTLRFAYPIDENPLERPVGAAGFSHIYASQSAVDTLFELDELFAPSNSVIGVPWPQMALDVRHSRVFNMRKSLLTGDGITQQLFYGRVDNLLIVIPREFGNLRATRTLLRPFMLHQDWRRIRPEIEDFYFMYSGQLDDLR